MNIKTNPNLEKPLRRSLTAVEALETLRRLTEQLEQIKAATASLATAQPAVIDSINDPVAVRARIAAALEREQSASEAMIARAADVTVAQAHHHLLALAKEGRAHLLKYWDDKAKRWLLRAYSPDSVVFADSSPSRG